MLVVLDGYAEKLCVLQRDDLMLNNNISIINRTGYDTIIHSVELGVEYNESRDRVCWQDEEKKNTRFRSNNYDGLSFDEEKKNRQKIWKMYSKMPPS